MPRCRWFLLVRVSADFKCVRGDFQPFPFDKLRAGSSGLYQLRFIAQHCVLG
jgi:hypothetical protein